MDKKVVTVAPASPNLSSGIISNGPLFVSGLVAGDVVGFEAQARAVFDKVGAVLEAGGADFSSVVRCGLYLSDIRNFQEMNRIYAEYFTQPRPARTTIECKMAEPTVLIEIDCVAAVR